MNKLMAIPLAFMALLMIFSIVYSTTTPSGILQNLNPGHIGINGTNSSVDVPGSSGNNFDISGAEGAMVILVVAVAIGIIAGIRILASGLTTYSQSIIFKGCIYLGLYAILSIITANFLFATAIFSLLWLILTIFYIVGFASEIQGGTADE